MKNHLDNGWVRRQAVRLSLTCSIVKAPSVYDVVTLPEVASNTNVSRDSQS